MYKRKPHLKESLAYLFLCPMSIFYINVNPWNGKPLKQWNIGM